MLRGRPLLSWGALLALLLLAASPSTGLPPREDHEPPAATRPQRPDTSQPTPEDSPAPPHGLDALRVRTLELARKPGAPTVAADHVVVRFEETLPDWQREQIVVAAGGLNLKAAEFGRFAWVNVKPGDTPERLAQRLTASPGVLLAEVDPLAWPAALSVTPKLVPTDPFFPLQWHHQRIRLPEAFDLFRSQGEGVIVAVIDSGVAFGNGTRFPSRRADDLEGVRFLPGRDYVDGGEPFDRGIGPDDLSVPRFGHGTFAAGQIAAGINNGFGAGIAPKVTILPIRVLPVRGFVPFSIVAEAMDFAVAQGAKVINLSLGGAQSSTFLEAAVARTSRAGVIMVASTGNENGAVSFPARYPEVIGVGATRFEDSRASYSNFGDGLDLMAPAGDNANRVVGPNQQRDGVLGTSFVVDLATGEAFYGGLWSNGTSFAAPQVSAAAALLLSIGVRDPAAVRAAIESNLRDLSSPGMDNETGRGLLDLAAARRGIGFAF